MIAVISLGILGGDGLLEKINEENPRTILLVGRAGVGKSYTGQKISELGYEYVAIDELLREMKSNDIPNPFCVYNDMSECPEVRELLFDKLHSYDGKVVFDGMLLPDDVERLNPDLLIFIEPDSWEKYGENLRKRVAKDIELGEFRTGIFWRFVEKTLRERVRDEHDMSFIESPEYSDAIKSAIEYNSQRSAEEFTNYERLNPYLYKNKLPKIADN